MNQLNVANKKMGKKELCTIRFWSLNTKQSKKYIENIKNEEFVKTIECLKKYIEHC